MPHVSHRLVPSGEQLDTARGSCDALDGRSLDFDATEAMRMKAYLQTVVSIDTCMPLASRIPSREPISFYDLLLRGVAAEPGERDKTYVLALNEERTSRGKVANRLPLENVTGRTPDPDEDPIMGPSMDPALPPCPRPANPAHVSRRRVPLPGADCWRVGLNGRAF